MRINEILLESVYSGDIHQLLTKQISEISHHERSFENKIAVLGYEKARVQLEDQLNQYDIGDWYFTNLVNTDAKISATYNKRQNLIARLRERIKNGL